VPVALPDVPATIGLTFGHYDFTTGAWFANVMLNEKSEQHKIMPRYQDAIFTPDGLIGDSLR
jgi:hypothetical protein